MRRAARVDANHPAIVKALRKIGCKVIDLAPMGGGVPDLLVWHPRNGWLLLEVKTAAGKLNARQKKWHAEFAGCLVFVVRDEEEAIAAVTNYHGE